MSCLIFLVHQRGELSVVAGNHRGAGEHNSQIERAGMQSCSETVLICACQDNCGLWCFGSVGKLSEAADKTTADVVTVWMTMAMRRPYWYSRCSRRSEPKFRVVGRKPASMSSSVIVYKRFMCVWPQGFMPDFGGTSRPFRCVKERLRTSHDYEQCLYVLEGGSGW